MKHAVLNIANTGGRHTRDFSAAPTKEGNCTMATACLCGDLGDEEIGAVPVVAEEAKEDQVSDAPGSPAGGRLKTPPRRSALSWTP